MSYYRLARHKDDLYSYINHSPSEPPAYISVERFPTKPFFLLFGSRIPILFEFCNTTKPFVELSRVTFYQGSIGRLSFRTFTHYDRLFLYGVSMHCCSARISSVVSQAFMNYTPNTLRLYAALVPAQLPASGRVNRYCYWTRSRCFSIVYFFSPSTALPIYGSGSSGGGDSNRIIGTYGWRINHIGLIISFRLVSHVSTSAKWRRYLGNIFVG